MKRPGGGPSRRRSTASTDRQMLAAETLRQMQPGVAPAPRIDLGLDRGRGGSKHDRNSGNVAAHHRHVAGMVVHAVLLLVGRIVLLIDHDQAEIRVGQEQRRARADDHAHLPGRDRLPGAGAPARRKLRMPLGRPHAKARREPVQHLRGQRDLGHQHERLPAAPHGFGHRLEIDLRLAGAGDAIDQRDRVAAGRDARAQRRRRRSAAPASDRAPRSQDQAGTRPARAAAPGSRAFLRRSGRRSHRARRPPPRRPRSCRAQGRRPARRPRGRGRPSCAPAARRRAAHRHARAPGPVPRPCAGTSAAPCRARPAYSSRPSRRSRAAPACSGGTFELLLDVFQAIVEARIGRGILGPDHPGGGARAQRHAHEIARRQRHVVRHAVRIGLVERDRQQNVDDLRHTGLFVIRPDLTKAKEAGEIMPRLSRLEGARG